jgi:catechol 2,3-dioxygenase-like lactoylglutathione lyase family enzyme
MSAIVYGATMTPMILSHVGLAVSDLDAAVQFFTEALGFEAGATFTSGDEVADLAEIDGGRAQQRMRYVMKDGFRIELMCWIVPGPMGTPSQSRAHLGLTHLCVQVDDVDVEAARVASYGATILERTRTKVQHETEDITMLCVSVLDGLRIELLQRTPHPG